MKLPAVDHGLDVGEALGVDDRDHPLLGLGDHHLPRLHPLLPLRHAVEVDVDPVVGRHLRERRREPGGAAVLQREDEPALDELDGDLDQALPGERVADLHRGALVGVALPELGAREHGRAADPVAPGRRAVEDDERALTGRLRAGEPRGREQADAHRVHEAVRGVRIVEHDLAADVGDADAVAVVADPADGAREVVVRRAEAEAVEQRDRTGAHRRDVAENPADAGRGALERLDRRRMVVALDLEGDGQPVTEVDHPAFSPGPWRTRGPSLGSRRSRSAECLYPQCSDQSSEKTASSKWFGSRPSSVTMRSSSPSVRPSWRWSGCSATELRRPV